MTSVRLISVFVFWHLLLELYRQLLIKSTTQCNFSHSPSLFFADYIKIQNELFPILSDQGEYIHFTDSIRWLNVREMEVEENIWISRLEKEIANKYRRY